MEQLILNIKQPERLPFIKEVLSAFTDYLEIGEPSKKKSSSTKKDRILKSLKQGMREVELIKQGRLKGTSLKEFLNELLS